MVKLKNYPILVFLSFIFLSTNAFLENKYFASNSSFEVIPEKTTIFNDKKIFLVARFSLDKNWHTYWINPGDSGEPASFNWNLPKGFEVSKPIWPSPELIPYPPLTTFGYTDEMKVLFELSIPAEFDEINEISVVSKWLVCADVCIPQKGDINFTLEKGNWFNSNIQNLLID